MEVCGPSFSYTPPYNNVEVDKDILSDVPFWKFEMGEQYFVNPSCKKMLKEKGSFINFLALAKGAMI